MNDLLIRLKKRTSQDMLRGSITGHIGSFEIGTDTDIVEAIAVIEAQRGALEELVDLKVLRDRLDGAPVPGQPPLDVSDQERAEMERNYRVRKPKAWEKARALLGLD